MVSYHNVQYQKKLTTQYWENLVISKDAVRSVSLYVRACLFVCLSLCLFVCLSVQNHNKALLIGV